MSSFVDRTVRKGGVGLWARSYARELVILVCSENSKCKSPEAGRTWRVGGTYLKARWLRGRVMWGEVGKPADHAGRALDFILSAAGRHGGHWLVFHFLWSSQC